MPDASALAMPRPTRRLGITVVLTLGVSVFGAALAPVVPATPVARASDGGDHGIEGPSFGTSVGGTT